MLICAFFFFLCGLLGIFFKPLNRANNCEKTLHNKLLNLESEPKNEIFVQTSMGSLQSCSFQPEAEEQFQQKDNKFVRKSVKALKKTFNFKLLVKNVPFLMIVLSNFLNWMGLFIPFIYLPKFPGENDLTKPWFQNLVSIIGDLK